MLPLYSLQPRQPGQLALRDASKWSPSSQNSTHLKFGSDSEPLTSVVQSDYTAKPIPEVRTPTSAFCTRFFISSPPTLFPLQFKQCVPEGLHDIHLAVSVVFTDYLHGVLANLVYYSMHRIMILRHIYLITGHGATVHGRQVYRKVNVQL